MPTTIHFKFDRTLILIAVLACMCLYANSLYGVFSAVNMSHETDLLMGKLTHQTLIVSDLNHLHEEIYYQSRFLGTFANIVFCLPVLYQFIKCFVDIKENHKIIVVGQSSTCCLNLRHQFYLTLLAVLGGIAFVFVGVSQYGAQQPQMGSLYWSDFYHRGVNCESLSG